MRRLRSHLTYANIVATLALVIAVGGGAAYAANTVFSSDIVDNQVYSADVRNDGLAGGGFSQADLRTGAVGTSEVLNDTLGGGLSAVDLRSGSVGPSEAAGLGPADIVDAPSGSDKVNADTLDGLDSSGLVQGRGKLLAARFILLPDQPSRTLFAIPGLGRLEGRCETIALEQTHGTIQWSNTTNDHIELWDENNGTWSAGVFAPFGSKVVAESLGRPGSTFGLGFGDTPGARRTATVNAFVSEYEDGAPCTFQAQAMLWTVG